MITWWIKDLHDSGLLPEDFPLDAVLSAMVTITINNIFGFGDLYFLQLLGTAMGTSAAVIWATLYYTYHEVHTHLPKHRTNLLYYKRFIDDVFCIWTDNLTTDWTAFKGDDNTFGVLKWDTESVTPSSLANFLDKTLTIYNNKIITKTQQKEMNFHLNVPPSSEPLQVALKVQYTV